MKAYKRLRAKDFSNCVDVYVRNPKSDKFWFVGKSAANVEVCDPSIGAAVQKRIIFEHAKLLQTELRRSSTLQLWIAPPNTELEVAKHQITLAPGARGLKEALISSALGATQVGFDPEQYLDEAKGFYVRLEDDGRPAEGSQTAPKIVSPEELSNLKLSNNINGPESID